MKGSSNPQDGIELASSATGTTFLILIQVASRMFTFISNQLVLRSLSPAVLGIAAQLELYQVSILYFSRESIRMAIQRQPLDVNASKSQKPRKDNQSVASQSVVNISYLSLFLGIPLTIALTLLYQRVAPQKALEMPSFNLSVAITGLAAVLELSAEPFFAIIQQRMWYQKRAMVEMPAAFIKSLTTCSIFLYVSHGNGKADALPFALGHLSYSLTLIGGYCLVLLPRESQRQFSFLPALIQDRYGKFTPKLHIKHKHRLVLIIRSHRDRAEYLLGRFSRPLSSLAVSVFFQSVVKHLLTQGDSMMLAAMASLDDQGIYSLASNYGGLIARIVFQPLEESSRNIFSKLLTPDQNGKTKANQLSIAKKHLADLIHVYQLLAVLIFPLGPILVPHGLRILGGRQWASAQVGELLSLYCYYIPFLAFNGITEAFVASAANPREIRQQTAWMGAFSACYALAAYLFLNVWMMGAYGLVLANIVNMMVRTLWSYRFIQSYFGQHENSLHVSEVSIQPVSCILGVLATIMTSTQGLSSVHQKIIHVITFSVTYGICIVYLERQYLMEQTARVHQTLYSRGKGSNKTE